jgi:hypothetical protein
MRSRKEYDKKYFLKNREKLKEKCKKYYRNNLEKARLYKQRKKLKKGLPIISERKIKSSFIHRFSINGIYFSKDEYNKLLLKQNSLCAICNQNCITGRKLAVDHNHKTEKVRGLLCFKCNRAIGLFNDEPFLVKNAYNYLLKNN